MTEAELRAMSYHELRQLVMKRNNLAAYLDRLNDLDNAQRRIAGWLLDLREAIDHTGG